MYEFSPLSDRVKRVRARYRDTVPYLDIERYRLVTEFYMNNRNVEGPLKRALNFKNLCEKMPIYVREDELIVGSYTASFKASALYPEYSIRWIIPELEDGSIATRDAMPIYVREDELIVGSYTASFKASALYPEYSIRWIIPELEDGSIATRDADPYLYREEDRAYILETASFWDEECLCAKVNPYIPEAYKPLAGNSVVNFTAQDICPQPIGHFAPNYYKPLHEGFAPTKAAADRAIAEIEAEGIPGDKVEAYHFYRSVSIVCEGIMTYDEGFAPTKAAADRAIAEIEAEGIPGDKVEAYHFYRSVSIVCEGIMTYAKRYSAECERLAREEAEIEAEGIPGDKVEAYHFYRSVSIVCEGIMTYAKRYSAECERLAREEADDDRKAELLRIADVMSWVIANPARDFRDAIQALWFYQMCILMDANMHGTSIGRFDQLLGEYVERDLASGAISWEEAQELVDLYYLKVAECNKAWALRTVYSAPGYTSGQLITLGGVDEQGNDATNPITYMGLEAMGRMKMHSPTQGLRVHEGTPRKLWECAIAVNKINGGVPSWFNDAVIKEALVKRGIAEEDVWNYCLIGCVEPSIGGAEWPACGGVGISSYANFANMLQFAINAGKSYRTGPGPLVDTDTKFGPSEKRLCDMESIDEVKDAYLEEMRYWVDWYVAMVNVYESVARRVMPQPVVSAMMTGCMESGKDVMDGGAKYNSTGISGIGLGNVAESLNVIDPQPVVSAMMTGCMESGKDVMDGGAKYNSTGISGIGLGNVAESLNVIDALCFEEKSVSTQELYDALLANWEGYEELRERIVSEVGNVAESLNVIDALCFEEKSVSTQELYDALLANWEGYEELRERIVSEVPHYGNGDPRADRYCGFVADSFSNYVNSKKGTRGNRYAAGLYPVTMNVTYGKFTAATPDGRRKGEPLSDGISAVQGYDTHGPTAILNSVSNFDTSNYSNGLLLNMKFHPSALSSEEGVDKLIGLMSAYFFKMKGMEMQLNVVSADTLRAAQENPEEYKDLVVRIAGFSAYFTEVYKAAQDDLIRRTELGL